MGRSVRDESRVESPRRADRRARDAVPDYFVTYDEYGRNSYITVLTGMQMLFGPTPYSMRFFNTFCS